MFNKSKTMHNYCFTKKQVLSTAKWKKQVHHKKKKLLPLSRTTGWPLILVWYHDVILYDCFASLNNVKNSSERPFFRNYDSGYNNNSREHSLFILMDRTHYQTSPKQKRGNCKVVSFHRTYELIISNIQIPVMCNVCM